jgi:hypothetical protein
VQGAACEWRLGQLLGGDEGARRLARAAVWMRTEGIVNGELVTELHIPGGTRS